MARSAFTGGLFLTLLNHVGPLQGEWGHWGALIRLHGVSGCCQRPSRPTMSTVAVSVPYWGHTAAVCLLVDGITRLRLPTNLVEIHAEMSELLDKHMYKLNECFKYVRTYKFSRIHTGGHTSLWKVCDEIKERKNCRVKFF